MKKVTYLLAPLMLLLILTGCNNNENNDDVISQKYIHKYGFEVSEQEWIARNENGKVITELQNGVTCTKNFQKGILHGETTYTFPKSNIIQEKCEYDEGNLVKHIFYDISGLPLKEYSYDLEGRKIITIWDKKGVPLSMEEYVNDSLVSARYYNVQNEIESTVINGSGNRIKRDRDGRILSREKIINGQISSRTTYHPNGEIQSTCSFKDYKLHGTYETFAPNKKLISRANWIDGKLDGVVTCYRNDNLFQEIPYTDGLKHGTEKEYNLDGSIAKEIHWEHDQRHGSSRYYFDDYTDIQWYFRGMAVDLKKFQMLEFRDELMAEINSEKKALLETPLNENSSIE